MKTNLRILLAVLLVGVTVSAFAALSEQYVQFGKGPAQYLMTKEELAKWNSITEDSEAKTFIEQFWARRDPQFRQEFERRVAYADKHYKTRSKRGSMTDRGRILVVFGPPTKIVTEAPDRNAQSSRGSSDDAFNQGQTSLAGGGPRRQIWTYDKDRAAAVFGVENRVDLSFMDRFSDGDFALQRSSVDLGAAQARLMLGALRTTAQPAAQQAPAQQAPPAVAAPAVTAAAPIDFKNHAFHGAVDDFKAGKTTINKNVLVSYAEFVSPMGEYFVPVQIFVPKAAGLTADSVDTIFGVVEDAAGKRVAVFEEPVKLLASKEDFVAGKTLSSLPAGKYTVTVGLAKGAQPVAVNSAALELKPVGKEDVGLSRLLLLDNIFELSDPAPVKAPFAFGRLKIVPKANLTFTSKDELGYFVEVHNPSLDPATNLPKLQVRLDLVGKDKTITAPLTEVPALPLAGTPGPGQYAIVNTIPLAQLSKPLAKGDYTLRMKVVDTISQKSYTVEQKFKIAG